MLIETNLEVSLLVFKIYECSRAILVQSLPESKRCKSERQCPCQYVSCYTGSIISTMCSWYGSFLCLLQLCVKYKLILFIKLCSHSFWCCLCKSSEGEKMSACMHYKHVCAARRLLKNVRSTTTDVLKRKICYAVKNKGVAWRPLLLGDVVAACALHLNLGCGQ